MNKVRCFLSGGHKYSDSNWVMTERIKTCQVIFTNYCDKCGKMIDVPVSRRDIFSKDIDKILHSVSKGERR